MKNIYIVKYVEGFGVILTAFESKKDAQAYLAQLGGGGYKIEKISFQKKTKTLKKP